MFLRVLAGSLHQALVTLGHCLSLARDHWRHQTYLHSRHRICTRHLGEIPLLLMARACFPLCRHHLPFPASLTSRISCVSRWCTLVSIACDCIMHLSGPFNLVSLPIFPSFVHVEPISISPAFSLSFLKCLHSTTPFAKPLSLSLCARLHHCTTDVIADGR